MDLSASHCRRGFSLTELLIVVGIVVCLCLVAIPGFQLISKRAALTGCINNERQLGVALGQYAADHRGKWPFPDDNRNIAEETKGTWISRLLKEDGKLSGMGKLFPYVNDRRAFVCPGDAVRYGPAKREGNYDSSDGTLRMSYVIRGFNQSRFPTRPVMKNLANMGRRAIYSCQFAYVPSNPKSYPLSWHGTPTYPVLFSDGSVQVFTFPEGSVNLKNPPDINNNTTMQISVWDFFDGHRKVPAL